MKLSIKQKLIGSFIIVSLLFSTATIFSYNNMKNTNESYEYVINTVAELKSITQEIQTNTALQIGYYRAYMLYNDPEQKTKLVEVNNTINKLIVEAKDKASLKETKDRLDDLLETNKEWMDVTNKSLEESVKNKENAIVLDKKKLCL